jgi:ABC-type sugar transport system substrate-binding protein
MSRSKTLLLSSALALCVTLSPAAAQDAPLEIVFVHHSSASNTF